MLSQKPYNPPAADQLRTRHCDEWILVCDKPSGLLSVPGRGPEKAICASSIAEARHGPVFIVHRLDMDTSGLMILARTQDTQRALSRQFEQRTVKKGYEALVEGNLQPGHGTVNAAIAKFSKQRPLRHLAPDGREAITHWRVMEHGATWTRVDLSPETGRSHQLRLHMQHLGHPILGDVFYGDPQTNERLCLHAKTLEIRHPVSAEAMTFSAEVPF